MGVRACKKEGEGEEGSGMEKRDEGGEETGQMKEEKEKQGEVKLWRTSKIKASRTVRNRRAFPFFDWLAVTHTVAR